MNLDLGKISVSVSDTCISIYWVENLGHNACVESDQIIPNHWMITRALVRPDGYRNQGLGSHLLKILIEEIKKKKGKSILVTPGGYDGETEKQFRFYEKNGFITPKQDQIPAVFDITKQEHLNQTRIFLL
ncbi:MAG: GNAT family N-acetyltransferase [Candidatus Nanoarchaeia archaeon]|jgi:GNAT superfamily N-acetyltransferase|nr:GNAT family N-acetyltransferase [Candidatus Nanoarchaeia archaeon]